MIIRLGALGRVLRPALPEPTAVAELLAGHEAQLRFRRIVQEIVPERAEEILAAREDGGDRENAQVWAFLRHIETHYFPLYELEEYDQVACGIPFVRFGWGYERYHDLDMPAGELLLFTLCAQPFEPGQDTRVPLLDAAQAHVPPSLLTQIPQEGFTPEQLHQRLDGTHYAAAAQFADWLWADTGTVFLDLDDELEIEDAEWTRENVLLLAEQWQQARAILERITELADWLEAHPPTHFAQLLDAVLERDAHLSDERERRSYACEITEAGLVPIPHDGVPLALPPDAASGSGG